MNDDKIKALSRLFLRERGFVHARDQTPDALDLAETHKEMLKAVKVVGNSGDLDEILSVERMFIETDLAEHTTSPAQRSSLKSALEELAGAEKTIPLTTNPKLYVAVDTSHSHPKTRVGGLPKDAARKFFSGNNARLLNMDKARLTQAEKKIIHARRDNMYIAEKIYAALQRQALGLTAPDKGRDKSFER